MNQVYTILVSKKKVKLVLVVVVFVFSVMSVDIQRAIMLFNEGYWGSFLFETARLWSAIILSLFVIFLTRIGWVLGTIHSVFYVMFLMAHSVCTWGITTYNVFRFIVYCGLVVLLMNKKVLQEFKVNKSFGYLIFAVAGIVAILFYLNVDVPNLR